MSYRNLAQRLFALGLAACSSPEPAKGPGPAATPEEPSKIRPAPTPRAARPAPRPHAADDAPYFVTQALYDEMAGDLVTEEAVLPPGGSVDATDAEKAARPGFEDGTFLGRQSYRLRRRDPQTGALRAELAGDGRPRPPLLDAAGTWLIYPTLERDALVIEAAGQPLARLTPPDRGHRIARARRIPGTTRVLVLTRPASERRPTEARLLVFDAATGSIVRTLSYRYKLRAYRSITRLEDMNEIATYDGCLTRKWPPDYCRLNQPKRYEYVLPRDRGLDLVVTRSGSRAVVYAFGDLFVYDLAAGELGLVRTVHGVFYADKDYFTLMPSLVLSPSGRYAALNGTWRLVQRVDLEHGTVTSLRDASGYSRPWLRDPPTSWAPNAWAAFTSGDETLLYLALSGKVMTLRAESDTPAPLALPRAAELDAERLFRAAGTLVLWRNSAVHLLRVADGSPIRTLGTALYPRGFDPLHTARYVRDRTRFFDSPSSPAY